jgi:hypothetical protein
MLDRGTHREAVVVMHVARERVERGHEGLAAREREGYGEDEQRLGR